MRPSQRIGASSSTSPTDPRRVPASTIAAVPSVGRSAAVPGNGVAGSMTTSDARTAASPTQPIGATSRSGRRRSHGQPTASRPPSASSQARVGSE